MISHQDVLPLHEMKQLDLRVTGSGSMRSCHAGVWGDRQVLWHGLTLLQVSRCNGRCQASLSGTTY